MYNKTGKISRSYSENDFQHYYQHNTKNINENQQQIRMSNNFQQQESKNYIENSNMLPNPLRVNNKGMNAFNLPPQQQSMRKSSVSSAGSSMNQNLRMSKSGLSSSILKNNQQLRQSQMMNQ